MGKGDSQPGFNPESWFENIEDEKGKPINLEEFKDRGSKPIEEGEIKDERTLKERAEMLKRAAEEPKITIIDAVDGEDSETIIDLDLSDRKTSQKNIEAFDAAKKLAEKEDREKLSAEDGVMLDAEQEVLLQGIVGELAEKDSVKEILMREGIAAGEDEQALESGVVTMVDKLMTQPQIREHLKNQLKNQPDQISAIASLKRIIESTIWNADRETRKQHGEMPVTSNESTRKEIDPAIKQETEKSWSQLSKKFSADSESVTMREKKAVVQKMIRGLTSDHRISALVLTEGQNNQSEGRKPIVERGIDALAERMTTDLSAQINFELQSARKPEESLKIIERRILKEVEKIKDSAKQKELYKAKSIDSGVPTWESRPRFGEARKAAKAKRTAEEKRQAESKLGPLKKFGKWFGGLFDR